MATCLICDTGIQPFIDFGSVSPQTDKDQLSPLAWGFCPECTLSQVMQPPELLPLADNPVAMPAARADYLANLAEQIQQQYMRDVDFVVEMGGIQDALLPQLMSHCAEQLGIRVTDNIARRQKSQGLHFPVTAFTREIAEQVIVQYQRADVIYCHGFLSHLRDLHQYFSGISALLSERGILVFEAPAVDDIILKQRIGQLSDQNFVIFTAQALDVVLHQHNMALIHIETRGVAPGMLRYIAAHQGARSIKLSVYMHKHQQQFDELTVLPAYRNFADHAEQIKTQLQTLLQSLKSQAKTIAALGTIAEGSLILNYCQLDASVIECFYSDDTCMQQLYSSGSAIPIKPQASICEDDFDYILVCGDNDIVNLTAQVANYGDQGGQWISYYPNVRVHEIANTTALV